MRPAPDGIKFAVFYTKLHNRLLRPLMAADQAPLMAADQKLGTKDR